MVSDTTVDTTSPSVLVTFQPGFESLAERDIRAASPKSKVLSQLEPGVWHVRGDLVAGLQSGLVHALRLEHVTLLILHNPLLNAHRLLIGMGLIVARADFQNDVLAHPLRLILGRFGLFLGGPNGLSSLAKIQ